MVYILPIWKHIHNAYIFPLAELPETPLSWQFSHLLTFFLIFRLSKKLKGGCHKEVGAPKMGLCEARGLCPDAPVFFNLFPGIWTGAHPPQGNTIPHAFQRSRIFLLIEMPHEIR